MNKIIWESQHLEVNPMTNKMSYGDSDCKKNYYEEDFEEPQEGEILQKDLSATPFGIWRVDDDLHPMKQFKLWMGHTNFDIGKKSALKIQSVPGVELLRVFTRYRFIVGIGRAFDTKQVKLEIEKAVCGSVNLQMSLPEPINRIKNYLVKNAQRWSLLVYPNGNFDFSSDHNNLNYDKESQAIQKLGDICKGLFLNNECNK